MAKLERLKNEKWVAFSNNPKKLYRKRIYIDKNNNIFAKHKGKFRSVKFETRL